MGGTPLLSFCQRVDLWKRLSADSGFVRSRRALEDAERGKTRQFVARERNSRNDDDYQDGLSCRIIIRERVMVMMV